MNGAPSKAVQSRWVVVWDPPVRIGHWALVAAFAVAYLSAEEGARSPNALHVWSGYAVGVIVALRILWGFVGSKYARFSDFICGPVAVLRYLLDLAAGRVRRYVGHSPVGGAMVIALLVFLAATVAAGVVAYGERGKGPLAADGQVITTVAHAAKSATGAFGEGERAEGGKSIVGEVHGALANVTLALVIFHLLGVGLASYAHRENLVAAMLTGKKRAEE